MMTARELLTLLSREVDLDARVVIRGYEGGYDDVTKLEKIELVLDVNKDESMGRHDDARGWDVRWDRYLAILID